MPDTIEIRQNADGSWSLPAIVFVPYVETPMPPAPPVEPPAEPPAAPPPASPAPPDAPAAPVAVSQVLTIDKDPTQLHVGDVITFAAMLTMSDGNTKPATAMALNCYDGGILEFAHSWGPTATMIGVGIAHIFNDNSGTRGYLDITVLDGPSTLPPPPPSPPPAPPSAPPTSNPPPAPPPAASTSFITAGLHTVIDGQTVTLTDTTTSKLAYTARLAVGDGRKAQGIDAGATFVATIPSGIGMIYPQLQATDSAGAADACIGEYIVPDTRTWDTWGRGSSEPAMWGSDATI